MKVHLVDGTYELFRYHYAPSNRAPEIGATRGVLSTVLDLVADGATHIGVATDHVIESFRNDLYGPYKDGSGVEPDLKAQFPIVEQVLEAAGFTVWPMIEFEADDALAAAAAVAGADDRVEQAIICTPDKDLAQCVIGDRIVQLDRRRQELRNADGVVEKFGVAPASIPDWLGLVGDSADGFPGLAGWGAKSAATVLAHYGHIEAIPAASEDWEVKVRGGAKLARTLVDEMADALLFRRIATLETDVPVGSVDDWRWTGPTDAIDNVCDKIGAPRLAERARSLAPA